MRPHASFIISIALLVTVGGPLLLAGLGLLRRQAGVNTLSKARYSFNWRLCLSSALFYTLAFNLIFFIQELFLVLPKAFTPNIVPVLFHNNHDWTGENPLARLFQGTGAVAIFLIGILALGWLSKRPLKLSVAACS